MSDWKPDSDLMRLNAALVGRWIGVPDRLMTVLRIALDIAAPRLAPSIVMPRVPEA